MILNAVCQNVQTPLFVCVLVDNENPANLPNTSTKTWHKCCQRVCLKKDNSSFPYRRYSLQSTHSSTINL